MCFGVKWTYSMTKSSDLPLVISWERITQSAEIWKLKEKYVQNYSNKYALSFKRDQLKQLSYYFIYLTYCDWKLSLMLILIISSILIQIRNIILGRQSHHKWGFSSKWRMCFFVSFLCVFSKHTSKKINMGVGDPLSSHYWLHNQNHCTGAVEVIFKV